MTTPISNKKIYDTLDISVAFSIIAVMLILIWATFSYLAHQEDIRRSITTNNLIDSKFSALSNLISSGTIINQNAYNTTNTYVLKYYKMEAIVCRTYKNKISRRKVLVEGAGINPVIKYDWIVMNAGHADTNIQVDLEYYGSDDSEYLCDLKILSVK